MRSLSQSSYGVVPPLDPYLYREEFRELVSFQYENLNEIEREDSLDEMRALLMFAGDTFGSMPMNGAVQIFEDIGMEPLSSLDYSYKETRATFNETLSLRLNGTDGILLSTDTLCNGRFLRNAHVHFNWIGKRKSSKPYDHLMCAPGITTTAEEVAGGVWAISAAVADGIRFRLDAVRKHGSFVWPWVTVPTLKILHRRDEIDFVQLTTGEQLAQIKSRLTMIPMELRKAMALTDDRR